MLCKDRSVLAALLASVSLLFILAGCGGDGSSDPGDAGPVVDTGPAVVERGAEGDATVVRNVSGSRWGGEARLVEELAIGVESGDEPYMLGQVVAAWQSGSRIFLADMQAPAVRAYDAEGRFLFDVGAPGQGPGEYQRPAGLAVHPDGRIFVADLGAARINVYAEDGAPLDTWELGTPIPSFGLQLGADGTVYTRVIEMPDNPMEMTDPTAIRQGVQAVGADGLVGEPRYPPPTDYRPRSVTVSVFGNEIKMPLVPFEPQYVWVVAPSGEMIAGVGTSYRFEIHAAGATTIVEKTWEPVPVDPDEATYRQRLATSLVHRVAPDWSWSGPEIPENKPAFSLFQPDRSGRLWVMREGPGEIDPECAERTEMFGMISEMSGLGGVPADEIEGPCWRGTPFYDVFEIASGEFLGTVPPPERGFRGPLFIDDDTVLAAVMDDAGIQRLKRYRLQLPAAR